MKRLITMALSGLLLAGASAAAKDKAPPSLPKGTQIGVVNLLDPEVMHYHSAKQTVNSFFKIHAMSWNVDDMLNTALQAQPAAADLKLTAVAPTDALLHARESCFVNAALKKGLPKSCAAPLAELAAGAGVNYLIVMAPGINNEDHLTGPKLEESEMLRGWGFVTHERSGPKDKPSMVCEVELLLISVGPEGVNLRARQWGGSYNYQWQAYTVHADPKAFSPEELEELQPLFATILTRHAKDLMEQVHIE